LNVEHPTPNVQHEAQAFTANTQRTQRSSLKSEFLAVPSVALSSSKGPRMASWFPASIHPRSFAV